MEWGDGRFARLEHVGDESGHEVDEKIHRTAVSAVLGFG